MPHAMNNRRLYTPTDKENSGTKQDRLEPIRVIFPNQTKTLTKHTHTSIQAMVMGNEPTPYFRQTIVRTDRIDRWVQ